MSKIRVHLDCVIEGDGLDTENIGAAKLAQALVDGLKLQGITSSVYLDQRTFWPRRKVSIFPMPGSKEAEKP